MWSTILHIKLHSNCSTSKGTGWISTNASWNFYSLALSTNVNKQTWDVITLAELCHENNCCTYVIITPMLLSLLLLLLLLLHSTLTRSPNKYQRSGSSSSKLRLVNEDKSWSAGSRLRDVETRKSKPEEFSGSRGSSAIGSRIESEGMREYFDSNLIEAISILLLDHASDRT